MAVRDWLQRIMGSASGTRPGVSSSPERGQPVMARPGKDAAIAYAIKLSGFVIDHPDAMAFYQHAFADYLNGPARHDDFRKQGDLLDKDALKAFGLRSNVRVSAQFLATLNERGRSDPLEAAGVIGLTVSTALGSWHNLEDNRSKGVSVVKLMAAERDPGPCTAAAKIQDHKQPIADACLLPFETCDRLGRCACTYLGWLPIMDELGA